MNIGNTEEEGVARATINPRGISVKQPGYSKFMSITDSLANLSKDIAKLDYASNKYRNTMDNPINSSLNNSSNNQVNKELKIQNNLLTQLLNVMQNNNSDNGIHLTIENFNNNRNIDIKNLYEELEYYKYQSKLARGGI